MLQEINNFMNSLPAELKQAGLKPKEGLHVLLKIQEKEGTHFMDEQSVCRVCLTRKATEFDYPFLQHCAELAQVGWCVNTNKCFDLPAKGLHSCSPYCIALKRESLEGGGKYAKDKTKIYDRIDTYFANALSYVEEDSEKERIRVFQHFINSKEKLNALFACFQSEVDEVKDKEYIILYLEEEMEKYRRVHEKYLSDKLFNTNEYNISVENQLYGTSDFLNGFPTKKPFLSHQSAVFDIAGRITGEMAGNLMIFRKSCAGMFYPVLCRCLFTGKSCRPKCLRFSPGIWRMARGSVIRRSYGSFIKIIRTISVIIIYCITMAIRFVISILFPVSAIVCRVGIKKVGW